MSTNQEKQYLVRFNAEGMATWYLHRDGQSADLVQQTADAHRFPTIAHARTSIEWLRNADFGTFAGERLAYFENMKLSLFRKTVRFTETGMMISLRDRIRAEIVDTDNDTIHLTEWIDHPGRPKTEMKIIKACPEEFTEGYMIEMVSNEHMQTFYYRGEYVRNSREHRWGNKRQAEIIQNAETANDYLKMVIREYQDRRDAGTAEYPYSNTHDAVFFVAQARWDHNQGHWLSAGIVYRTDTKI